MHGIGSSHHLNKFVIIVQVKISQLSKLQVAIVRLQKRVSAYAKFAYGPTIYSVPGSIYLLQKISVFPPFPVSCMIGVDDHVALVYLVGNGTIWQWQCVSLIFFFLAH